MFNLAIGAAMGLAVFVTQPDGNVDVWDSVPNVTCEANTELHVEVVRGYVHDDDGCGTLVYSTDGAIDARYNYISYHNLPVEYGDNVTTVLVYECDEYGDWCDDIILRADIIDGVYVDDIAYTIE